MRKFGIKISQTSKLLALTNDKEYKKISFLLDLFPKIKKLNNRKIRFPSY